MNKLNSEILFNYRKENYLRALVLEPAPSDLQPEHGVHIHVVKVDHYGVSLLESQCTCVLRLRRKLQSLTKRKLFLMQGFGSGSIRFSCISKAACVLG